MRELTPVSVIAAELSPPTGSFWTSPDWYDPQSGEPGYTLAEVSRFFFARSRTWLNRHVWRKHLVLDGEPVIIPRDRNDYQRWRLYDVELTAHALAQGGYLKIEQLHRAIGIVKLVAQNYKYLLPSPIETRIEPINNVEKRKGLMAVETLTLVRDDLDESSGASTRHFAIGEIHYQIDLTDKNWEAFLELINPYVVAARPDRRRRLISPEEQEERSLIRQWAAENGHQVGSRGRIPYEVVDAYKKAQEPASKRRRAKAQ